MTEPKPRNLFLIDGIGALVSAILLGVVLVRFQPLVGIPVSTLYFLAALPCGFVLFDLFCYFSTYISVSRGLRTIGLINKGYCILSIVLALFHFEVVTALGWVYIIGEVVVVMVLARYELRVGQEIR